ncbi:MAG: glycosyltransferase [Geminocystis sp.]|nr:glycosyltransferase [Geminocystis sp.]MCX8078084.1 glycosyltransferase [Geminocystis sp.]MDW8116482.1 glycosyltransferase [Geminocystis sp.]MDW8462034.1 glycosyltransferase [Geminocystis sp.]
MTNIPQLGRLGVVTIGRNEGERLVECLKSLQKLLPPYVPVVYVDSGSTDGSPETARGFGVTVISLDASLPFTAARGRNTGWKYLLAHYPHLDYIQFLDGDCELLPQWLEKAISRMEENPQLAAVCGRVKEKYPLKSVYNLLMDMEWNTPVGEALYCGGNALIRVEALKQVDGYNSSLICGEEPEMCIRLRRRGWKIERLPADMVIHDASMYHFSQWWRRMVRGGWAVAQGFHLYGRAPENYKKKELFSGFFWGFLLPFFSLILIPFTSCYSLLLLILYPILFFKIFLYRRQFEPNNRHAFIYAFWCVISKFPQFIGQVEYWLNKLRDRRAVLIEYK